MQSVYARSEEQLVIGTWEREGFRHTLGLGIYFSHFFSQQRKNSRDINVTKNGKEKCVAQMNLGC